MEELKLENYPTRIQFPGVRECILKLIRDFSEDPIRRISMNITDPEIYFKKLDIVKKVILSYHHEKIPEIMSHSGMTMEAPFLDIKKLYKRVKQSWNASNEFYTLFDVKSGSDVYIDPNIITAIGIPPEKFRTATPDALVPETSIYYKDDIYPSMRFAMIGYATLSLPGFSWRSFQDHYMARFRINSRFSQHKELQAKPYFVLEKRCYFGFDSATSTPPHPNYHLDRYTIYPDMEIEYPTRSFVTNPAENGYINAFSYFFNAYLLGIQPKFIMMLEERLKHDRYKAIAKSMNEKAKSYGIRHEIIDEHQVADCFSKTIRVKIESAMREWNKTEVKVDSDQDAVNFAGALGLLPLSQKVREMMYKLL